MKEVNLTIRIEPDLRAAFTQAAEAEHRPASQVLRELMRGYISHVKARASSSRPSISAEERAKREKAVKNAQASVALEGFMLTEGAKAHAARFINGEIDLSEFVQGRNL